jgi:hypothetical protein
MSAARRRMPDEVRRALVRAFVFFAFAFNCLMLATLGSLAHMPRMLTVTLTGTGIGVFGLVFCLLEALIGRQIAAQRRRGPGRDTPIAANRQFRPAR